MHELQAILRARRRDPPACRDAVLATVAHVEGSAYRRPGARMLLFPDGRRIGSISGGCLEGDVLRKAWWFTEGGRPSVRVYDTRSDDDAVWEFGLGCDGVVTVLLERVATDATESALAFLERCQEARTPAAVLTVLGGPEAPERTGERLWRAGDGSVGGTLAGTPFGEALALHADACLRDGVSFLAHVAGHPVFVEYVPPPLRLTVFGAGHDALPLVSLGSRIGWEVVLADPRPTHARPDRFPEAAQVVRTDPSDPLAGVPVDPEGAVVLMTHSYPLDRALLPGLLVAPPRYLGLLGSRKRAERLFAEIGRSLDDAPVHAPIGLDIGADTPETIALSVVAEIQAALSGRSGGMLRKRSGPIHAAVPVVGPRGMVHGAVEHAACEIAR